MSAAAVSAPTLTKAYEGLVIERPLGIGAFHFVVVATLRTKQLMRGCVPRVSGFHKKTTLAQIEVAGGQVLGTLDAASAAADPALARP